ncbi:GNAT family N-acetyltransferase [Halosolutus halophilus]|uniref:GNAT family N-acetyltransferase n=1 Tax=Halosolutus halophilus TaxID=1552990 RepID=UPI002234F5B7|nr:GNAT family N-acetyltransferase [Halosolutus halophilus]
MTDAVIRGATVADAEALAAVYRSAYSENQRLGFPTKAASATSETVEEWVEDSRLFVAQLHDEIVGGVRLEVTNDDRVKLSRLAVHEEWKGEGIGSELLDHAETEVREWGHSTVWLTTPEEHPYLPDLYRNRGYEKTAPYPLEYREYDEIVMEKRVRY